MSKKNNNNLKIGARSNNGWIFAGSSLWVAPEDEGVMTLKAAKAVVKKRQEEGNNNIRLMRIDDFKKIFNLLVKNVKIEKGYRNKGFGAKFKVEDPGLAGKYWIDGNGNGKNCVNIHQWNSHGSSDNENDVTLLQESDKGSVRLVTNDSQQTTNKRPSI